MGYGAAAAAAAQQQGMGSGNAARLVTGAAAASSSGELGSAKNPVYMMQVGAPPRRGSRGPAVRCSAPHQHAETRIVCCLVVPCVPRMLPWIGTQAVVWYPPQ